MELIFERSRPGRGSDLLPPPDVPASPLPEAHRRAAAPRLPEVAESEVSRHYQAMARMPSACATGSILWAPVP